MPRPCVAYPAYINGRGSRIFANAASGMTPLFSTLLLIQQFYIEFRLL